MKLLFKPSATLEQRKFIRSYCNPFETSNLMVVLTDDFTFKPASNAKYRSFQHSKLGVFRHWKQKDGKGFLHYCYGFREISLPVIVINCNLPNWKSTFLHEFGHYIDFKTNPDFYTTSSKQKEKFARQYSRLAIEKI